MFHFNLLTLTSFSCESLPPTKEVGAQQISTLQVLNFAEDRQLQRWDSYLATGRNWQQLFLTYIENVSTSNKGHFQRMHTIKAGSITINNIT